MNQEPRPQDQDQEISPAVIAQRAEEIAVSDGRSAAEVTDADYARAQAELARPLPAEQLNPEPTDGFRRADIASATPGTKAASEYDEDPQIGADLVEQGIQEAVHDDFVESGRETLGEEFAEPNDTVESAEAAQEKIEEAGEPLPAATFTEPAIAPIHIKKARPPAKRRAAVKPAWVEIPAPAPVKAAKKSISRAKPKPSPQPKAMAQPKTKAKAKAPTKMKAKPKTKAKAKAAPKTKAKVAARRTAPKKTLPAKTKTRMKAPAKTKAKPRAKARPAMKAKVKTKVKRTPKPKTKAKAKPQAKRRGR